MMGPWMWELRSPKEMGGEGGGTNPEQLFAVGYAACFESALGVIGRRERAEVGDVSIDSRVSLLPTEERGFKLAVELDVTLPQVQDPEQAARIVLLPRHTGVPVLQSPPGWQHRREADRKRPRHRLNAPGSGDLTAIGGGARYSWRRLGRSAFG